MESKCSVGAVARLLLMCYWLLWAAETGAAAKVEKIEALFIFGDSLIDVGNNNYLPESLARANFPHNGIDFLDSEATGRFSNGLNSGDFIAQKLGLGQLSPPPYLSIHGARTIRGLIRLSNFTGVNFASASSGILNKTGGSSNQRISLSEQVQYFLRVRAVLASALGEEKTQQLLHRESIVVFVVGSNDIFSYPSIANTTTVKDFLHLLTSSLKIQLQKVYNAGARKLFFVGVGPLGCCPGVKLSSKDEGCDKLENELAILYNKKVHSLLSDMSEANPDFLFAFGDAQYLMSLIFEHPEKYGFKNVSSACCGKGKLNAESGCTPDANYCGNRSEFFFWDLYHPTQAVVGLVVDKFFNGSTVGPLNLTGLVERTH